MGVVQDSMEGSSPALQESAITLQQGGGVGTDFLHLAAARGARTVHGAGGHRAGVLHARVGHHVRHFAEHQRRRGGHDGHSAVRSSGHRRSKSMPTRRRRAGQLQTCRCRSATNSWPRWQPTAISPWPFLPMVSPRERAPRSRCGRGRASNEAVACRVWRRVRARELWQHIVRAAYQSGEPG